MKFPNSNYFLEKADRRFDRSDAKHREVEKSVQNEISRLAFGSLEMTFFGLVHGARSKFRTCPDYRRGIQASKRKGAALLVVLFVIMAITILALGFLSQSDVELACGQNMMLRTQMDYLAESGLQHAKGLILNPQDVGLEYWAGATGQQLAAGSEDYYDVTVVRDDSDRCNYMIDCNSYRLKDGQQVGLSSLTARLRLDPCIALWTGSDATLWSGCTIEGDVYCDGVLANEGVIDGDVFADALAGSITGRHRAVADLSLAWPQINFVHFISNYATEIISSSNLSDVTLGCLDPVRVCCRIGSLTLAGDVRIDGMLIVNGDLTVRGNGNIITAGKNLPAIFVTDDVKVESGGNLQVNGLAVLEERMLVNSNASDISILGGLFVKDTLAETAADSSGKGNTGILYNGPTWQPLGGQTDGALEFDGVDDYVQTYDDPDKLQLASDCNYTLSVWIKPDSKQKRWAGIFSKTDPGGTINHWALQFDSTAQRKLIIYHPGAYWDAGIDLLDLVGRWHHIAVVRRGELMTSYLNGGEVHSNTWKVGPGSGNGHLNIGADRTASSNYVYKGMIDDIRIYNRALDANDIYPPVDGLPGLIGHWRLDETGSGPISVTAAPAKTAVVLWSGGGIEEKWGQVAGAFFRSIGRK